MRTATDGVVGAGLRPEYDSSSPTGYRFGQHRLVLPQIDGYHWLLQAEQELAGGGVRVRSVTYDDEPAGREVHWAGFLRWWGLGVAGAYHVLHPAVSAAQALERVAPWANTALLVVLLLALTPLLAARLGSLPGAVFALGSVAVFPLYYFFSAGYFDHHGAAAMANVLLVLFLVCGGVGWVRADDEIGQGSGEERALLAWLPTRRSARRWIIASGLVGAVGLWISAASMAPVLLGLGIGAAVAVGVGRRSRPTSARWIFAPELFRLWGIAGGLGSFAFYLLEYFPSHMGMRLEVNHPLYAIAFVGGGDLLARWGALVNEPHAEAEAREDRGRSLALIGLDALLVLMVPLAILIFGVADFRLRDPFLWHLHASSIIEFQPLVAWYRTRVPSVSLGELTLIPLAGLPIAAALWPTALIGARRLAWRALLLGAVAASTAYAGVFFDAVTRGSIPIAVVGGVLVLGVWFALPLSLKAPRLAAPWETALLVCLVPATGFLIGALIQMRWMGNASALWLATVVVFTVVLTRSGHAQLRTVTGRAASLGLAGAVFVLAPAAFLREPLERPNGEMIMRDASLWLRRRVGAEKVVLLAGPTPTSSMVWFGGFQGLGTLYWENLEGLRATSAIASAPSADSAKTLLAKYGVTHLAFYTWDGGLQQVEASANEADGTTTSGFLGRLDRELAENRVDSIPPWMVLLPYRPATVAAYPDPVMHIVEIVPDQKPEIALARLAQYYEAIQSSDGVDAAVARSLAIAPSVPALAMRAQLARVQGAEAAFAATVGQLRDQLARGDSLDIGDRLDAAIVLGLANDAAGVVSQFSQILAQADEARLRRLPPKRLSLLVDMSRRLGLDQRYPDAIALAQRLALPG